MAPFRVDLFTLVGDSTDDSAVGPTDFNPIVPLIGWTCPVLSDDSRADLNGTCDVGPSDFNPVVANMGHTATGKPSGH